MKVFVTIVVIVLLAGLGFWIWKANYNKKDKTEIVMSIVAFNQTKNVDAASINAAPRDVVVYSLTVENKASKVAPGYVTEVNIADITEIATLIDAQGANYNSANNSLVWTPLDVPARGSFDKKFTVRVKDSLPANSDAVMTAKFNNELAIKVDRTVVATPTPVPAPSPTPSPNPVPAPTPTPVSYQAPKTGATPLISIILAFGFTLGALLFHQARRIKSEPR